MISAAALVITPGSLALAEAGASARTERGLVLEVCRGGPDAAVAAAQRAQGQAAIVEAAVLPNPSLWAERQQSLTGLDERQTIVALNVPVGISGRYFLRRDAADAKDRQEQADAEVQLFEAALLARAAYADAVLARAKVAVLTKQQAALERLTEVIAGLTKGGELSRYDLLRQELEADLHRRRLLLAEAQAEAAELRLARWTSAPLPLAIDPLELAQGADSGDAAVLIAQHPQRRSLEAAVELGALELRAAERRWIPDLEVLAGYREVGAGQETGHGLSASLTVPLTFFDHGQGEAAQAHAQLLLAQAKAGRFQRQSSAELRAAAAQLDRLEAHREQFNEGGVLRLQDEATQLYAAGEANITELLEAYHSAEALLLSRLELAAEIAQVRLARMRLAGSFFDPELDQACLGHDRGSP
ncbi:MAG: TolC family protein [Deltaproteobacteria bacterium]|nr:TolC family protein [Deltaproteobacteria bacterium]